MLTKDTLATIKATITDQYHNHEITVEQFAALTEDIKLTERRTR